MKKSYIVMAAILICTGTITWGCSSSNNSDEQQSVNLTPSAYLIKQDTSTASVDACTQSDGINFIVDRTKVRETDLNISVDAALKLLIEKEFKDENLSSSSVVFSFQGYECLADGTCYIISYGSLQGSEFIERRRFAISYNKTIYEAPLSTYNDGTYEYTMIYSLDEGQSSSYISIEATIENGTLTITDQSDHSTLGSFPLKKYGLTDATNENIIIMDMNFDGYLDVAITMKNSDEITNYNAFLYKKKKNKFSYEISYKYLNNPVFNYDTKTISCNEEAPGNYTYDTYSIVNDQPEISNRVTYTYRSDSKDWQMKSYEGRNGNLITNNTKYYTTDQVRDLTGSI